MLECQGNKGFGEFAIARAHTLAGVDKRSHHMIQITVVEQFAITVTTQEHEVTRCALDPVISSREGLQVEVETETRVRQESRNDKNVSAAS